MDRLQAIRRGIKLADDIATEINRKEVDISAIRGLLIEYNTDVKNALSIIYKETHE